MKKNSLAIDNIIKILLLLFVIISLLLPAADMILSKKLIFVICIALYGVKILFVPQAIKISRMISFKIFFMFTIALVYSIPVALYNNGDFVFVLNSLLFLLIVFCAYDYSDTLLKFFLIGCNILSIVTIILILLPIYSKPIGLAAEALFLSLDSGFLGQRDLGSFKLIMVHFRTAPLQIISFSIYFTRLLDSNKIKDKIKNFIAFGINGASIVISASRGSILFSFIALYLLCFFNISKKKYRRLFYLFTFVGVLGFSYLLTNSNAFDSKEESNSVKLLHIKSFNSYADQNPFLFLLGHGTGSKYYTAGFGRYAVVTEITYLDMIRWWGVFGTIIMLILMVIPIKKISIKIFIPFFMYFINAATNPLIFSSVGMLAISVYFLLQIPSKESKEYD